MKFKTGLVLGAVAGAWAVRKAAGVQRGGAPAVQKIWAARPSAAQSDETAEKLRAFTGLARERLAGVMEGPFGNVARERISDLIGSALGGSSRSDDSIDANARWPR